MPCNLRTTYTISWKEANDKRVVQAITDLNLWWAVQYVNKRFRITASSQANAAEIEKQVKRQYAELTLRDAAKQNRWQLSPAKLNAKGQKVFQVTRR